MKQHTITTYSLNELSDKAKEVARDWYRKDLEFYDDAVMDDARTIAKMLGIEIEKIYYDGFSSQGDGACFSGTFDAKKIQPGKVKEYAPKDEKLISIAGQFENVCKEFPNFTYIVKHCGHYFNDHYTEFTIEWNDKILETFNNKSTDYLNREKELWKAETNLISISRDLMKWIYVQLEKDWDYQISNQSVDENIMANDYQFTEAGKRSVVLD